jgi:hypothetical protein
VNHFKQKGNGAAHLWWKKNTSLWWEMVTPHPTLWVRNKIEGWRETRSRCGRGSNHVHYIWKFHLDLIRGWSIPPNSHWFKDRKRAIDWGEGKREGFVALSLAKGKKFPFGVGDFLEGVGKNWGFLSFFHQNFDVS